LQKALAKSAKYLRISANSTYSSVLHNTTSIYYVINFFRHIKLIDPKMQSTQKYNQSFVQGARVLLRVCDRVDERQIYSSRLPSHLRPVIKWDNGKRVNIMYIYINIHKKKYIYRVIDKKRSIFWVSFLLVSVILSKNVHTLLKSSYEI